MKKRSFVSVIIPVFNDERFIASAIEALQKQTYPAQCFEIIVVDNGSTDQSLSIAASYPITVLKEWCIKGHGAARNKGIEFSKGTIIASIDADCEPTPQWIEKGVNALETKEIDMAAGDVRFKFSARNKAAEYFDAVSSMQNWRTVPYRKVAATANLFIYRYVFDSIGFFPTEMRSGVDRYFLAKAFSHGFNIYFCSESIVYHPARSFKSLVKKSFRVGKGKKFIAKLSKRENLEAFFAKQSKDYYDYLNPLTLYKYLRVRGYPVSSIMYFRILLISYIVIVVQIVGKLVPEDFLKDTWG